MPDVEPQLSLRLPTVGWAVGQVVTFTQSLGFLNFFSCSHGFLRISGTMFEKLCKLGKPGILWEIGWKKINKIKLFGGQINSSRYSEECTYHCFKGMSTY